MSNVITLDKNVSQEIYDRVVKLVPNQEDFEDLLDERLIKELFSREVVRYLSKMHQIDDNDFKRVIAMVNGKNIKISFGKIKKTQTSPSKLTYGII